MEDADVQPDVDSAVVCVEGAAPTRRSRGKNKQPRWKRDEDAELAAIRLPLDVHPDDERRLEGLFSAMWTVNRALQRDELGFD